MADIKRALALKKHTNPAIKVLVEHYKYLNIFLRKEANKLVEYRPYNYKIILKEGKQHGGLEPMDLSGTQELKLRKRQLWKPRG